ncbi:MAG TPA: LCP family protein [Gaiellales bacterium]|nr:LCP family protein [Gaiellales bacterium]
MNVYAGAGDSGGPRKPPKKRRGWVRAMFWSAGVLFAAILITAGVAAWWLHKEVAQVSDISKGVAAAQKDLGKQQAHVAPADQAATALVIGSDHRKTDGGSPSRSDTLILVSIHPKSGLISVLSLPRDLYVPIPGYGDDRINAAFSDGGEPLAVRTVTALTGIKPNYLIEVDFAGFESLVNHFGGIFLPIDQNYQHTNTSYDCCYKAIHIDPGYQSLGGAEALNFARFRHTDSDLYRNARQQTFLRQFQLEASNKFHGFSITDIRSIVAIIDDITKNTQVTGVNGPPSAHTMEAYAALISKLRGRLVTVRLQDTQNADIGGASVLTDTTADIHRAVYQFEHPQKVRQPTAHLPKQQKAHSKKFKPQMTPSKVKVLALNGTDRPRLAAKAAAGFEAWTYNVRAANAPNSRYRRTWIYYQPGYKEAAADLHKVLGAGYSLPVPQRFASRKADVIVVLGADAPGKPALSPPRKPVVKLPSDMVRTNDYKAAFAAAAHRAHLPGLYPSAVFGTDDRCSEQAYPSYQPNGFCEFSAAQPVRSYHLNASSAGAGPNSIYGYFQIDIGGFWGIEETHFTDAPILQSPNATRILNGRRWQYYYDGGHIHMIATIDNVHHVAYWVQNTLLDELSNADMIAIASSLRPTG